MDKFQVQWLQKYLTSLDSILVCTGHDKMSKMNFPDGELLANHIGKIYKFIQYITMKAKVSSGHST